MRAPPKPPRLRSPNLRPLPRPPNGPWWRSPRPVVAVRRWRSLHPHQPPLPLRRWRRSLRPRLRLRFRPRFRSRLRSRLRLRPRLQCRVRLRCRLRLRRRLRCRPRRRLGCRLRFRLRTLATPRLLCSRPVRPPDMSERRSVCPPPRPPSRRLLRCSRLLRSQRSRPWSRRTLFRNIGFRTSRFPTSPIGFRPRSRRRWQGQRQAFRWMPRRPQRRRRPSPNRSCRPSSRCTGGAMVGTR